MYLNVSMATPSSGSITCHTPKTPEILNSLINLTSPVQSSQYECQKSIPEVSSTDDLNSFEEYSPFSYEELPHFHDKTMNVASSPFYDATAKQLEFAFGIDNSSIGTPSPPVSELTSPVRPLQATKSALIKEGLKYQIRTKLQAAGFSSPTSFSEKKAFTEELTLEDEDRRQRRRERNKVAATKCRNKRKERTSILVNESEEVEGENLKLKTEIQRLKSEKLELEKLLRDPIHTSCCLRSNTVSSDKPVETVSLSNTTCCSNVLSTGCHYTASNNSIDYHKELTGMSYSALSIPNQICTPSYIYNHTNTPEFGIPSNKTLSKFSSYPLTCVDPLDCACEPEESDEPFTPLTSFSTRSLKSEITFKDKIELTSNSNLAVPFTQSVQDSQITEITGNYANPFTTSSILDSTPLKESQNRIEALNQQTGVIRNNNDISSESAENLFCIQHKGDCEANRDEELISLKTKCLPKVSTSMSTLRFSPYKRKNLSNTVPEYAESSILNNEDYSININNTNDKETFSNNHDKHFYPTCTFENIL